GPHRISASAVLGDLLYPVREPLQSFKVFLGNVALQTDFLSGSEQTDMALARIVTERFEGTGANLASRSIDDAQKSVVIIRVDDQAQVGHDVFDFCLGKERGAAADLVGDLVLLQLQLQQARLMVAPV